MKIIVTIEIEGAKSVCLPLRQQIMEMCSQYPDCTYSLSIIDDGEAVYEEKDVVNLELEDGGCYAYKERLLLSHIEPLESERKGEAVDELV